jgi:hypothetical protein
MAKTKSTRSKRKSPKSEGRSVTLPGASLASTRERELFPFDTGTAMIRIDQAMAAIRTVEDRIREEFQASEIALNGCLTLQLALEKLDEIRDDLERTEMDARRNAAGPVSHE